MIKYLITLSLAILFALSSFSQPLKLGFYATHKPAKSEASIQAAFDFISMQDSVSVSWLSPKKLGKLKSLKKFEVIWIHLTDTLQPLESKFNKAALENLREFVSSGGNLLLSREAFPLITLLGVEPKIPELVYKRATDNGYGRMLGFHAFRSHPVFEGLNGGAYVLKPGNDFPVRNFGYFNDRIPANGKVVATDWDYIFLRENKKLVLEYELGKGKILAVGAYLYFELPGKEAAKNDDPWNVNRKHLEKFTLNCIDYLAGKPSDVEGHFWNYDAPVFTEFDADTLQYYPSMRPTKAAHKWETKASEIMLSRQSGGDNFWDDAGERLLIMGKEKCGIEEIWAHPFMAFRDYEAGLKFSDADTILWLSFLKPMIEVSPESFSRFYQIGQNSLREVIAVSPGNPQGIIHYEYFGDAPAEMFIRFKTNQRLMWPYSHKVLGGMKFGFHERLNAFVITDPSGDFVSMLGFNKETQPVYFNNSPLLPAFQKVSNPIGHFDGFSVTDTLWYGNFTSDYLVSAMTRIDLAETDNLDAVFAATNEGASKTLSYFENAKHDPEKIYREALDYKSRNQTRFLSVKTPDSIFNTGYRWALEGADRFLVTTPGVGSSLVAGYGTTAQGWDGEHEVNGRPGYSWYFGRDAVWSGFAFLEYGDFEKVKSILELLQNYQDLNGKILHELSTSGFVHYDASDATPLYIALVGRYLKYSGDLAFIRESWPHIKAAMDFMYSTDTDGDGLIENTNVGHGWVEGGALFGSHTSLYLASCWGEALKEAAYMAKMTDQKSLSDKFMEDAELVTKIINKKFWDEEEGYFFHGFKQDDSFITEKSIMPAIPILFGQVDKEKSRLTTADWGTNNFTADWGARIISERSPLFNPRGYHTGSVWPLYTGWVALAEYTAEKPVQGFAHIMNNLLVFDDWALGFIEEVINGEDYKPSGVCHHQCWSQTMVLQPILEGMLGFRPDALDNSLALKPVFPANWDTVKVENIRVGEHYISFSQFHDSDKIIYHFSQTGNDPIQINFAPGLPQGTTIISKLLERKLLRPGYENDAQFSFVLNENATIELNIKNGIEVLPIYNNPVPGSKSSGYRMVDEHLQENIYTINFEGKPGSHKEFSVYINDWKPIKTEKAELESTNGKIYTYSVDFPNVDSKYAKQQVRIFLDK